MDQTLIKMNKVKCKNEGRSLLKYLFLIIIMLLVICLEV